MVYSRIGHDVDLAVEEVAHIRQYLGVYIRAEVAYPRRNSRKSAAAALRCIWRMHSLFSSPYTLRSAPAEAAVYVVDIGYFFHELGLGHVVVQIAAVFRRQRQLAVAEGAGAAPAAHDVADLILRQGVFIAARRNALANVLPLFHDENTQACIGQLQSRKNTGRPGPIMMTS